MRKNLKITSNNSLLFFNIIFIFTRITFNKNNKILFSGILLYKISPRKFTIYKDSTVKVEVLSKVYKKLYIISFISKKLVVLLLQKYLLKYNNSQLVNTTFKDLIIGPSLGVLNFSKSTTNFLLYQFCLHIVNYLSISDFIQDTLKFNMYSFSDKVLMNASYKKIS